MKNKKVTPDELIREPCPLCDKVTRFWAYWSPDDDGESEEGWVCQGCWDKKDEARRRSRMLPELEPKTMHRRHKQLWRLEIPRVTLKGPRGGVMSPQHIEWAQRGTGWLASVWSVCGCTVLYPYVRYLDRQGRSRRMPVLKWLSAFRSWMRRTGADLEYDIVVARLDYEGSEAREKFLELREECNRGKSEMGAKMATIVTSILDNGGSVSITSR